MVLVLMCFNSPSRLAFYLRVKAHGAWCSRSRLKGARILFSFANIFSSRQMSFFPFSSPQHFIASRDLYRVQVWGSVRVSHGGPVCTPALLMHLETRTVTVFMSPGEPGWITAVGEHLSFILVSFPGVMADENIFPLVLAGVVNHVQLCFPCNLLLPFLLK